MRISKDLSIYNEATGFSIHPRGMGGLDREALTNDLRKSVADGLVIPVELVQDDPILVRVVLGDLLPAEEEEWVGRVVWKLRIPCGALTVEGGLDPRMSDDDEDDAEFMRYVDVPPGDYRVEVLTYLHGINGDYCVADVKPREPLGAWFRRTRPGAEMPFWMKVVLSEEPELDPGHDEEWEAFAEYLDELPEKQHDRLFEENSTLDFVVRLTPLEGDEPELLCGEEGWFDIDTGARRPDLCPLGILFDGEPDED